MIFGPAGAGKTSVLNLIAGISDPEEGDIRFDEAYMNYVEPRERNVAMVFENYACIRTKQCMKISRPA